MISRSRRSSDVAATQYVRNTIAIERRSKSVAYQSASRSPNVRRFSPAENIPDPANGMDKLLFERPIDLLAQSAHQDIDDVRLRVEAVFPHVRQNHRLRHDLAGVAHQVLEQGELTG